MKSFIGLSVIAMATRVLGQISYDEWNTLDELNEMRAKGYTCPHGQVFEPNPVPLRWDCKLYEAARLHSKDMADQDYFSHTSLDGRSPWQRANEQGVSAHAENIAAGSPPPVPRWAASNGHCLNMFNPDMKVVVVGHHLNYGSTYDHYWTQLFSRNEPSEDTSCYLNPTPKPTAAPVMPTPEPTQYPTFAEEQAMSDKEMDFYALINEARVNGITCNDGTVKPWQEPLEWNCGLWKAARYHATDMATNNFFSHTGSDGKSHSDRAERFGVADADYGCTGMNLWGSDTVEGAWASYKQLMCKYYFMESKYQSFGVGYAYNPDSDRKHYWTLMLGNSKPTDDLKSCQQYLPPTPQATPRPTKQPTPPTYAPTPEPTLPTNPPTSFPTFSEDFRMLPEEMELFDIINDARMNGITCNDGNEKPAVFLLEWDCGLWKAAHYHTNDMAKNNFFSHTGSNGDTHSDRAARFGVADNYSCTGFNMWGKATAAEAWVSVKQMLCNHYFMETKYSSIGIGYTYNPDSDRKHYWTMMMGPKSPSEENQYCLQPVETSAPTVQATPIPTAEPTMPPTDAPTASPTDAPTDPQPTDAPTDPEPTSPPAVDCKDLEKSPCKSDSECAWKGNKCQDKTKVCPKQSKENKCNKYGCNWQEGVCSW